MRRDTKNNPKRINGKSLAASKSKAPVAAAVIVAGALMTSGAAPLYADETPIPGDTSTPTTVNVETTTEDQPQSETPKTTGSEDPAGEPAPTVEQSPEVVEEINDYKARLRKSADRSMKSIAKSIDSLNHLQFLGGYNPYGYETPEMRRQKEELVQTLKDGYTTRLELFKARYEDPHYFDDFNSATTLKDVRDIGSRYWMAMDSVKNIKSEIAIYQEFEILLPSSVKNAKFVYDHRGETYPGDPDEKIEKCWHDAVNSMIDKSNFALDLERKNDKNQNFDYTGKTIRNYYDEVNNESLKYAPIVDLYDRARKVAEEYQVYSNEDIKNYPYLAISNEEGNLHGDIYKLLMGMIPNPDDVLYMTVEECNEATARIFQGGRSYLSPLSSACSTLNGIGKQVHELEHLPEAVKEQSRHDLMVTQFPNASTLEANKEKVNAAMQIQIDHGNTLLASYKAFDQKIGEAKVDVDSVKAPSAEVIEALPRINNEDYANRLNAIHTEFLEKMKTVGDVSEVEPAVQDAKNKIAELEAAARDESRRNVIHDGIDALKKNRITSKLLVYRKFS